MVKRLQKLKANYLLYNLNLSLGEIQNHTTVERVVKQGRKSSHLDEYGNDLRSIVRKRFVVKGTSIPASTLKKFLLPKNDPKSIEPRERSIKKLSKMYDRIQYQRLRSVGANYRNARRLKSYPPKKVNQFITSYIKSARKIQTNYENTYYEQVKAFKRQERDKLYSPKPVPPPKPPKPPKAKEPPPRRPGDEEPFEDMIIESAGIYSGAVLDEEEEEVREERPEPVEEIKEPLEHDYPSLDEIIYGMGEVEHTYSEWENIADTSGLTKK